MTRKGGGVGGGESIHIEMYLVKVEDSLFNIKCRLTTTQEKKKSHVKVKRSLELKAHNRHRKLIITTLQEFIYSSLHKNSARAEDQHQAPNSSVENSINPFAAFYLLHDIFV